MTSLLNRRQLLSAAPFAAAVVATPALSGEILPPLGETPIIRLYHEYYRITDAADAFFRENSDVTDDDLDRLFYIERDRVEDEMMALPCQSAGDFAAKVIVSTVKGSVTLGREDDPLWAEARALIG